MEKISEWVNNKGLKIDKIYASSALRTVQSAQILSDICETEFEILDDLKSRKAGVWSGLSFSEIEQKYPNVKLIVAHIGRAYSPEDLGDALDVLGKETKNMLFDFF